MTGKAYYIPPQADLFKISPRLSMLQNNSYQTDLEGVIDLEDYIDDGILY